MNDVKSVFVEEKHRASGEYISEMYFSDLDRFGYGNCAEAVSIKEIYLKTKEVKEESSTKWL